MICQTVNKKHTAAVFPLTEPLTLTFLSKLYFFTQIKLPLSNGQEILHIVNILDKSFKTDTVQLTKVNCVRVWLHSQYQ